MRDTLVEFTDTAANLRDHLIPFLAPLPPQAMLAGLRTLIQTPHGPDRYVPSIFFDTMPSAPSRHARAKTSPREDNRAVLRDVFIE
jgi:hypothetical protein